MEAVHIRIPATVANLGPGFDCLGVAVGLYNRISFAPAPSESTRVEITGEGADDLPRDDTNLIVRSARALFDHAGKPFPAFEVSCENQIPLWRGLGSSAAAVVGGLVAANAWLDGPASLDTLLQLAAEIEGHPDNAAAALLGGLTVAWSSSGGARALRVDFPIIRRLRFVLAIPDLILPTEQARAALPPQVPLEDAVFNLSRTALLLAALAEQRLELLADATEDRLHQPYRKPIIPRCDAVFEAARQAGARAVFISGAGPTIAAIAGDTPEEIGQAMTAAFVAENVTARYLVVGVDTEGARAE